jgi:tryptophan-rich sensory protein
MPFVRILIAIIICQAAGFLGAPVARDAIATWYQTLHQPPLTPPAWVFAPAWITLYVLMGISAGMIWNRGIADPKVQWGLGIFLFQLGANSLWTPLFFGLHQPTAALIDILILWLLLAATIINFFRQSHTAGWLLIPYLIWVTFATYLNAGFVFLNR